MTTDAADPPAGDAAEVVGTASYWLHEAEFLAASRALHVAMGWPAGFAWRLAIVLLGHLLLAIALLGLGMGVRGGRPGDFVVAAFLGLPGLWLAWRWGYGRRRRLRRQFADFPSAGLKMELTFTRGRLMSHSPKSDASLDWRLFPAAVELRDGFILLVGGANGVWIPKHALRPPGDPAVAAFLRSKIARYRVANRTARPSE